MTEWPVEEMKTRVIDLMTKVGQIATHQTIDATMTIVYELANFLGAVAILPRSMQQLSARAIFVNHLDTTVIANIPLWISNQVGQLLLRIDKLSTFLDKAASESYYYITDISDVKIRVNTALRLWVGYLEAAKMIR